MNRFSGPIFGASVFVGGRRLADSNCWKVPPDSAEPCGNVALAPLSGATQNRAGHA